MGEGKRIYSILSSTKGIENTCKVNQPVSKVHFVSKYLSKFPAYAYLTHFSYLACHMTLLCSTECPPNPGLLRLYSEMRDNNVNRLKATK